MKKFFTEFIYYINGYYGFSMYKIFFPFIKLSFTKTFYLQKKYYYTKIKMSTSNTILNNTSNNTSNTTLNTTNSTTNSFTTTTNPTTNSTATTTNPTTNPTATITNLTTNP